MIKAVGLSQNDFDPAHPGRLCRGRERWIDGFEIDSSEVVRTVITGATFEDDSAANALRGLSHSGLDLAAVVQALFPRKTLVAFMEDGHPADIPDDAAGVEMYTGHRAGGRSESLQVRWVKEVTGIREIRSVLGDGTNILGFLWLDSGVEIDDELLQRIFLLSGMSTQDSPPARFQPAALPDILEIAKAALLIHRDKNGPAFGIYSREPLKAEARVQQLATSQGTLYVPFAIPPMLARWDRALHELKENWEGPEPFPVPESPEPAAWGQRRRRRQPKQAEE